MLYETIEEIDPAQVEAIEATGASTAQVMTWGVAPQIAPTQAGISVFRWDINIRESTVLGLVGAGGIGVKLEAALGTLAWPKVTTLLVVTPAIALRYWIPYMNSCIGAIANWAAAFAGVTSSNIIVPHH